MRKFGVILAAVASLMLMAFAAQAATATPAVDMKGSIGFGVGGGLVMPVGTLAASADDDGFDMKKGFDVAGQLDYFLTKDFAIGADASFGQMTNKKVSGLKVKTTQFGIHGRYLIPSSGPVVPYLQIGAGMYNRKLEFKPKGFAAFAISDTKPGVNGGVGLGYKVGDRVSLDVAGTYHFSIGKMEEGGEEVSKDWSYVAFNAGLTFQIKPAAK